MAVTKWHNCHQKSGIVEIDETLYNKSMKILVTGGAGYIGSITVKQLLKAGHDVVVFDSLEYGHKTAVTCPLIVGDLLSKSDIEKLNDYTFDAVIHFAAYLQVGESMENPYRYFTNNLLGGLNLLEYMKHHQIPFFVFSSTSAIFGTPKTLPVVEDALKDPQSVYGETKYMFERILSWYDKIFGIKSVSLRYFNAAGASLDGTLGEDHTPETHIIPVAISKAIKNEQFSLFGDDYPTPDGTCIRDYVHVEDLAIAHMQALDYLVKEKQSDTFNLGVGRGYSNKEVIAMVKKISGVDFPVVVAPRRVGDAAQVFADNKKATELLGFNPQYSDLETIVKTAWQWHTRNAKEK